MARVKHIPIRSCAACGQKLPKRELVRVVRSSDGSVRVDPSGKVPGRGTYLCARAECWEGGLRKNRIEYTLRVGLVERDREALSEYYRENLKTIGDREVQ